VAKVRAAGKHPKPLPLPLLVRAHSLAARAHDGQRQDADGSPYLEHALLVAALLHDAGYSDTVVAAGLLHDVIEKSAVTLFEIRARFGAHVAHLVRAMTEPGGIEPFAVRKAAHRTQAARAGAEAEAIFAADKVANAMTIRAAIGRDGIHAVRERVGPLFDQKIDHYQATLRLLERRDPAPPFLESLEEELRLLHRERLSV
jgi:guanosine-3',5'-bis(diphosphate) 3'-pyrophosphohydrolase